MHALGAVLLGQVEQAGAVAQGHAREPVELGGLTDAVVQHEVGPTDDHGQDAVDDLLG